MARLLFILGVIVIAFTVYALIDLILTEKARVRALNKPLWAVVIVILPALGGILWLTLGKGSTQSGGTPRRTAPDDDPAFLGKLGHEQDVDERIRRLEQELADLDVDDDGPNKE